MKRIASVLIYVATLLAAATIGQAQVYVVSTTIDEFPVTGERFVLTTNVRNVSREPATEVVVLFGSNSRTMPLSIEAPEGWICRRAFSGWLLGSCTAPALGAGAQVELRAVLLAPADPFPDGWSASPTFRVIAAAREAGGKASAHEGFAGCALLLAPSTADLGVALGPSENGGGIDVMVSNDGAESARDVRVFIATTPPTVPLAASGNPAWTCDAAEVAGGLVCRTPMLPSGAASTLNVRTASRQHTVTARVVAELSSDRVPANDAASLELPAVSTIWRRLLLPLTATDVAGANASLWMTSLVMLVRSGAPFEIRPEPCRAAGPCAPPPLGKPFDAGRFVLDRRQAGGQFLYVPAAHETRVKLNLRAFDSTRAPLSHGSEIPIVREHELFTGPMVMLGIPLGPQHRHTLRVYEADALPGSRVLVRLHFPDNDPVAVLGTLAPSPVSGTETEALLPSHPGFLQLDLTSPIPPAARGTATVHVEPVDPGLRLWSFVSITDSRTHHVTTITPR